MGEHGDIWLQRILRSSWYDRGSRHAKTAAREWEISGQGHDLYCIVHVVEDARNPSIRDFDFF